METAHNIKLTSAEISQLWSAYMNDSFSICVLKYFLNNVDDTQIRPVIEYSLELSQTNIKKLTAIFQQENFPIPYGFKEGEDVDLNSPRLFSDSFYLNFVSQMAMIGLNAYSVSIALSVRSDINNYFSEGLTALMKLHTLANEVLLSKGLYIRSPYIPIPNKVDFVTKQNFLTGFFGEKRPLTVMEITNLYANIQRNALGKATMIGYSQIAQSKDVKQFFQRGKEIATKHIEVFGSILRSDDLTIPMTWDNDVTESTTFVFSDKLMMFQVTALIGLSIGFYGVSMSISPRRDLGLHYTRLIAEIAKMAEDGANIMINEGWLEQPPLASDRDKLAGK